MRRSFGAERNWELNVVPDMPPAIAFVGRVEVTPRGLIILKYKAEDDYGVAAAEARIERITPAAANGGAPGKRCRKSGSRRFSRYRCHGPRRARRKEKPTAI